MENWWQDFFHGVALDFWRAAISDEQTCAEADFIQNHLGLAPSAEILDVPCGNGRLSIDLARRGFTLTGVDIATEFLDEAKQRSNESGLTISWYELEMRALPWKSEFAGAFCFGNSFGYLNDDENAAFLQVISETLKPGARFILDAPAIAECILPNFHPERLIELAGITTTIASRYDHKLGRMFNDFTFSRNGTAETRRSSQRIYTYRELTDLLDSASLPVESEFSTLDEQPFKLGAGRLLLVCRKAGGVADD